MKASIEDKISEYQPSCLAKLLMPDSSYNIFPFELNNNNPRFGALELKPFINDGIEFKYRIRFEDNPNEAFNYPRLEELVLTNRIGNENPRLKLKRIGNKVFTEYIDHQHKKITRTFSLTSEQARGAVTSPQLLKYIAHLRNEWRERYRH